MKSLSQTLEFLSQHSPKSDLDRQFIEAFIKDRFKYAPKTCFKAPQTDFNVLDVSSFIRWFQSSLNGFSVVLYDGDFALCAHISPNSARIICRQTGDSIDTRTFDTDSNLLCASSSKSAAEFHSLLFSLRLQPDPTTLTLVPKFIPQANDRVVFYDFSRTIEGVGVVRSVNEENGDLEFYCYYLYPTPDSAERVGYSMHESGIANLRDFIFEPAGESHPHSTLGNTVSCLRRLQRALEARSKVWKDRLIRIEPFEYRPQPDTPYFYITDKLEVVKAVFKDRLIARKRYYAGNCFPTRDTAERMLGKFNDLLRDYLASERWPLYGVSDEGEGESEGEGMVEEGRGKVV